MRPVLFRWRGLRFYSYPVLLYVGLVLGFAAGNMAANALHLDTLRVFVAMFVLLVPALIGGRLLFVALHWPLYRDDPQRILRPGEGGLAMYGGALAALPLSAVLLPLVGLSVPAFWDAAAFTFLVALIFGRFGCLLHGCCAGRPTSGPLGLVLPDHCGHRQRRYPAPLLDAAWAFTLLATAVWLLPRAPFPGFLFLFVIGGYGCGRLIQRKTRLQVDAPSRARSFHHAAQIVIALLPLALLLLTAVR